jgi:2-oxoglutarate ferredoxin oxidoreductase subunit beta
MLRLGESVDTYLRTQMLPTVWCPGCGNGSVAQALAMALQRLGKDPSQVVVVGGIGCSGRTPFYMRTNGLHTTHGRALAFATGLKMARPSLTVVVATGDGDALAIGGNHFLHAARRNIDLTVLLFNNGIYGMTGGQLAPTTPGGWRTTTTLWGNMERPLDAVELALAAGATYVARTTTFDMQELPLRIEEAIRHPGFALVEVLTQCPTYFGRLNRLGEAPDMLRWERDISQEATPPTSLPEPYLPIGVFRHEVQPDYTTRYAQLCAQVGGDYHGTHGA